MAASRNPDGWGRRAHKWRGRWRAYLTTGYKPDGRPERKYVYGTTQEQCAERLDDLRRQAQAGVLLAAGPEMTVAAYLEEWLQQKAKQVRPRTITAYERELRHLPSAVLRSKLARLRPIDVQRMVRQIEGQTVWFGKGNGRRSVVLTPRAANMARGILSNALGDAVRLGILASNPVENVRNLRHQAEVFAIWTAAQIHAFLTSTAAAAATYHALYYMALTTGMRPGELIAVQWDDIHGEVVRVQRTLTEVDGKMTVGPPKSKASNRPLALPGDTMEVLHQHHRGLEEAGLLDRLIFPTSRAGMVSHSNLRRSVHHWADKASVPRIRPHDLRHTFASMAISAGMTPPELARQLGHTDAAFTMRRYVKFFERVQPRSAPSLDVLTGALEPPGGTAGGKAAFGVPSERTPN